MRVLSLAPAARAWLRSTPSARVLHVFERACNLVNAEGEILSLVASEIGAGPFAVVAAFDGAAGVFSKRVEAGDSARVREGVLTVGPFTLDTRQAPLWQPRPAWERLSGRLTGVRAQLPALRALLLDHAPPGSLAPLVGKPRNPVSKDTFQGRLLQAARGPAETLCEGIALGNLNACRAGAKGLAGLGGGLTPSGDDFMMGALHALWVARPPARFAAMAEAIVHSAAPRTSRLSGAWLNAARRGEAGHHWHALVDALADDGDALDTTARHLVRVGHTSGADALAGFVCVLGLL